MKLLVNGDSYLANKINQDFATRLNCSELVNLASAVNSNSAIIRTTINYLESNPVEFVLIGLTFLDRFELSVDGSNWINCGVQGVVNQTSLANIDIEQLNQHIRERYKFDYQYLTSVEQLFCDIIMLSGYLTSKNIKFCIFNWVHTFKDFNFPLKQSINRIKNIVSLDDFSANQFLHDNGVAPMAPDKDLPAFIRHHKLEYYYLLENYLYDYCVRNQLI